MAAPKYGRGESYDRHMGVHRQRQKYLGDSKGIMTLNHVRREEGEKKEGN